MTQEDEAKKRLEYEELAKEVAIVGYSRLEYLIGDSWYLLLEIFGGLEYMPIKDVRMRK